MDAKYFEEIKARIKIGHETDQQQIATLKKELEAYKATGFTPEQISAGTTVTFDIGNDGFLAAINSAFKERFGITADDVPKIIAERNTLKTALELMAKDFYDASDDEVHSGPDGLVSDYIQFATHETHDAVDGERKAGENNGDT